MHCSNMLTVPLLTGIIYEDSFYLPIDVKKWYTYHHGLPLDIPLCEGGTFIKEVAL